MPPARQPAVRFPALFRWMPADARTYQTLVLGSLLAFGLAVLKFPVGGAQIVATLAGGLGSQYLGDRLVAHRAFEPRSALIASLSLCLLLRTGSPWIAAGTAAFAMATKFLIRVRGKHVFNPSNIALVAAMGLAGAWVSPGQWGHLTVFAFALASAGAFVIYRAARAEITAAFLVSWSALLAGRSLWLGEPLAIPLHRLQDGALVLFAFFMISDPRTTPDSRAGRVLFAALVAAGAYVVKFKLFRTNPLLWSLAALSPLVPVIDRLLPGGRFEWAESANRPESKTVTLPCPPTLA